MPLRARVKYSLGNTKHYSAHLEDSTVRKDSELNVPAYLEIQPTEGAYLLLYIDSHGKCITDTWHQTIDAAKAQANFEFGITEDQWSTFE